MVQVIMKIKIWIGMLAGVMLLAGPVSAAATENPEIEAQFKEGMEALEDNRLKSAIRAFSKILDAEPELHRAKLELALAYYRSMRFEDAEKLAKEVLDNPTTPPEVRVTILAFLAQIKRDTERYGQKEIYTGFASAGIMHDSNINVGPTTADIRIGDLPVSLTQDSLKKSDNAGVYNLGGDLLYQSGKQYSVGERTGMLVWQLGGSVYYRDYNKFNDFDLGVASINAGPALLVLRHWRASLQYKADYLTLGDRALALFNSINPSMTWQFNNGELNLDAIYTRRFYHRDIDSGREGDYLAAGLTLGRYLDNRKIAATLGGRAIQFFADDDQFGYTGFNVNAGLSVDTYRNGTFYARQRFSYFDYDGRDPLFLKAREEKEYRSTLGITHEFNEPEDLLKGWVANLFWERTQNDSNIGQLYSYTRYQGMLSLSRNF